MKILITNDDGIYADGINQLIKGIKGYGKIYVVAPSSEQSACGHGITVRNPIKVKECFIDENITAWAVDGTPADCIKLGITTLLKEKPDIVISGINQGPNLGTDVLYSGTVSAAIEAIVLGIPAIAISLNSYTSKDFSTAVEVSKILCNEMLRKPLAPDTLLNVNVPYVKKNQIKGFKVTRLGERKYINNYDHRIDPRGNDYYWLVGQVIPPENCSDDLDIVAVENNYISVTPIHFDLTNFKIMEQIKKWGIEDKDF